MHGHNRLSKRFQTEKQRYFYEQTDIQYWPCTHYRKEPIAENSYLFQYRIFLLFFCVQIVKYLYKLMVC